MKIIQDLRVLSISYFRIGQIFGRSKIFGKATTSLVYKIGTDFPNFIFHFSQMTQLQWPPYGECAFDFSFWPNKLNKNFMTIVRMNEKYNDKMKLN